jgi:hypothetical protein
VHLVTPPASSSHITHPLIFGTVVSHHVAISCKSPAYRRLLSVIRHTVGESRRRHCRSRLLAVATSEVSLEIEPVATFLVFISAFSGYASVKSRYLSVCCSLSSHQICTNRGAEVSMLRIARCYVRAYFSLMRCPPQWILSLEHTGRA